MDLWPGKAPGGEKVTVTEQVILRKPGGDPNDTAFLNVTKPWLMMRRPAKPNGAAILMIPGGGYIRVAVSKAGGSIDAWIADQGVTAFVMDYRLPADGWAAGPDVSLQDAQRAIRLIRANAGKWGLDPERIAVTGFSAGGHVAARLATRFATETYAPIDAADRLSTRPIGGGAVLSGRHHDRAPRPRQLAEVAAGRRPRPTPSAWRCRPSTTSRPTPRRPSSPPRPTTRSCRWRTA
jgi:carboxylesterase type B